jgi:hypothetical protein
MGARRAEGENRRRQMEAESGRSGRGDLVDMRGRRLRAPSFPRLGRQTPLQRMFLKRLQRLVLLSRYGQRHLAFSEPETRLMRRAIYSVYLDCLALGVGVEARTIIGRSSRPT